VELLALDEIFSCGGGGINDGSGYDDGTLRSSDVG